MPEIYCYQLILTASNSLTLHTSVLRGMSLPSWRGGDRCIVPVTVPNVQRFLFWQLLNFSLVVSERLPLGAQSFLYFRDRKVPETLRTNSERPMSKWCWNFFLSHSFTVLVETGGLSDYFKFFFISNFKYNNWNWNVYFLLIKMNFDKSGLWLPLPHHPSGIKAFQHCQELSDTH